MSQEDAYAEGRQSPGGGGGRGDDDDDEHTFDDGGGDASVSSTADSESRSLDEITLMHRSVTQLSGTPARAPAPAAAAEPEAAAEQPEAAAEPVPEPEETWCGYYAPAPTRTITGSIRCSGSGGCGRESKSEGGHKLHLNGNNICRAAAKHQRLKKVADEAAKSAAGGA